MISYLLATPNIALVHQLCPGGIVNTEWPPSTKLVWPDGDQWVHLQLECTLIYVHDACNQAAYEINGIIIKDMKSTCAELC